MSKGPSKKKAIDRENDRHEELGGYRCKCGKKYKDFTLHTDLAIFELGRRWHYYNDPVLKEEDYEPW